ncbi:MAG: hypothetical protein ACK45F_07485, partial [bacterium]
MTGLCRLERAAAGLVVAALVAACGQSGVAPAPSPSPASCQALGRGTLLRRPTHRLPPAGELVVRLRPGVPVEQAADLAAGVGAEVVKVRRRARALVVRPRGGAGLVQLSTRLAADPRVARVEPHVRVRALQVRPDDPLYPGQWALAQIRAPDAWGVTVGNGVKVAVVDTGILPHPDVPRAAAGYDFVEDDT